MHCFEHSGEPAIGVGMVCGRGLCRECAVETGSVMACRAQCEILARRISDLREFQSSQPRLQERLISHARQTRMASGVFMTAVGVPLVILGLKFGQWAFAGPGAGIMLVYGVVTLVMEYRRSSRTSNFRLCWRCGYNLTGASSDQCPECGGKT
ncbi:MAG: hypothetical protein BroJett003_20660 [Planctomycetota bacterium]|nr:MAG: hypothetical protein BroJett003_20660 [Planctomycetota bacterium]